MSILTTLLKILIIITGVSICLYVFLSFQQQMIYHPRNYNKSYDQYFSKVIPLEYETDQGKQVAFFYKGQSLMPPKNLWVMFGGNGSLTMDWFSNFFDFYADTSSAFLLIDYPGYGKCEGKANPSSIRQSVDKALETLYKRYEGLNLKSKTQLNAMGHSLGAAIALDFAARHPCKKIILLSPFTSLKDMARHVVGIPLCYLLTHHLDNHARLLEIAQQSPIPQIFVLHGTIDAVVPVSMGKKLAESFPGIIRFFELPLTDHQNILFRGRERIFQAIDGQRAR